MARYHRPGALTHGSDHRSCAARSGVHRAARIDGAAEVKRAQTRTGADASMRTSFAMQPKAQLLLGPLPEREQAWSWSGRAAVIGMTSPVPAELGCWSASGTRRPARTRRRKWLWPLYAEWCRGSVKGSLKSDRC
jgi:hypothetical protein